LTIEGLDKLGGVPYTGRTLALGARLSASPSEQPEENWSSWEDARRRITCGNAMKR
jgi:hypothetical protein